MKNFVLCIVALFLVFACSPDEDVRPEENNKQSSTLMSESSIAQNLANPYEQTGIDYYNQLNLYTKSHGYPNSVQQLTDQMLYLSNNSRKDTKFSKSAITITPEMIALILAEPEVKLAELIENSSLSLEVKSNLNGFVSDLIEQQEDDYDEVCSFIISYETSVIENILLQEDEKDTILKVASISRYSLYAEARRRDRDWETAITTKPTKPLFDGDEITIIALAVLFNTLQ
ncbi:hypothetical protein [Flavobacterium fluviatile]|uniref:hypothetical protein n=1 Tax=Flavobacterium fluviatile TaxID=1862387 RepID=UPI0013D6E6E3|nr:hypothetical protein [Flavobacterium fluviatile]